MVTLINTLVVNGEATEPLQELLQELSEVLYAQQRELDALRLEVSGLKKKLEGDPGLVDARQQERPPHY